MKADVLLTNAVDFFVAEHAKVQTLAHVSYYTPQSVTDRIGGYAGTLGSIAHKIITELQARDIKCRYQKNGNKRYFVIEK